MHCSQKKVRMYQKWTKRQNERPPESSEIELRPFRNKGDEMYFNFCQFLYVSIITLYFFFNALLSIDS